MNSLNHGLTQGPFRRSLRAAKANILPGLALQAFALVIVLGYYFLPPVTEALKAIAEFRAETGFAYSLGATAIFGGLIPFFYLKAYRRTRAQTLWIYLPFYVLFWAYRGIEVDLLYRLQSLLFGAGNGPGTIIPKVLFDQFVYNPLWAAPLQILAYRFMNARYDFGCFRGIRIREFYKSEVITALVSTWAVWIPMVTIIYCLPGELQIPLFNIVLCFWVLLFTSLVHPADEKKNIVDNTAG